MRVADRGTEVHVIDGAVVAHGTHHAADRKDDSLLYLTEREAIRFNRDDGRIDAINFVGEQLKLHGNSGTSSLSAIPMAVTGDIRCLDHPPNSVVVGDFEHDGQMYLFLEQSDISVGPTIYADRNSFGEIAKVQGNINMKIPAGARVNSYLLHFDPTTKRSNDRLHRVSGTITFRSPIIGVYFDSGRFVRIG